MRQLTVQEFNKLFNPEYQVVIKKVSLGGNYPQEYLVLEHIIGKIVSDELRVLCSDNVNRDLVPDIFLRKMFNR